MQDEDLESRVSELTEALERAKHSRDANAALLNQYASVTALMLKQLHYYKKRHAGEVASWHRSYREQLDEARRENSRLREQIWEMQTHASRANERLRLFRGKYDEDAERWKGRVEDTAARQELRFWKRMAMPEMDDDDPYWSNDDDVIDRAEKERLFMIEDEARNENAEDSDEGAAFQPMGGIAMQREESEMPMPPPRPLSAASSTGSTGQN